MRKFLFFCMTFCLLSGTTWSQNLKVSGKVLSGDDNMPLKGVVVSLKAKGKTVAVQTNEQGVFSIDALKGDLLTISYVGYISTEMKVGSGNSYTISLKPDVSKLNEVVVVGYGTQSRRNVTSAIVKLDKDVLENTPRSNIGTALQGTMSGLQVVNATGQPGASPSILLRGGASINSPGAPLVVVDGIIRSFNDISSEDIASIELLKDAAATAIYGARANNGVILITTKQGKVGTSQLSYKYTGGFNDRREGYKFLNTKDYIYYNRLGNLNSGRTLAQVNATRGYGFLTDSASLASFDIRQYSASTDYLLQKGWDTVGDPYGGTIIFKDHSGEIENIVFRNTRTDEHYINVMGGNEKGKYFASFDYYNEDGVIVGSNYKRYSVDLNGSYKVKPNLEISTGVNASTSSQLGTITTEVNTLYRTLDLWPTFNPWMDSAKTLPNPGIAASGSDGNPLYWLGKTDRKNEVNRLTVNGAAKWDLTKDLYIKATGSAYVYEAFDHSFTRATQLMANIYANPQTYASTSRPAYSSLSRTFQVQSSLIANYDKTLFKLHNINLMLGTEYYSTKAFDMQVSGTISPTDDISTVNASTTFAAGANYTTRSEYRIASTFGRLNYDYDQKYLLTLVFRRDGVSSLAEQNRYGFFPGMSAGWNLHKEKFFKEHIPSNIVSSLKPRISYGQNGNVAGLGRYEVQGTYGSAGLYNGVATFLNTGIINSNLRWEKSNTVDVGFDMGLLKNRLTVMFDYYDRTTSDLLTSLGLPNYLGFGSVKTNLGTYQNKGYEFTVNANLLNQPEGLKIDVGANASFVKNKIKRLPDNGNENNRQGGLQIYDPVAGKVIWVGGLQEGATLGDLYAFKQVSIFKNDADVAAIAGNRWDAVALIGGPNLTAAVNKITPGDVNWMDVDKNDTIDSRDQVYVGNIYPKWTGGFNLNVAYKGFSLYSRFEFALGHTIYNDLLARTLGNFNGTFNYFDIQKNAWSPTNTETDIPKVYYADQTAAPSGKKNLTRINNASTLNINSNNSRFYEKGDYLALREITLSYNFPKALLMKAKYISSLRAYISGSNLFYMTKFTGASPEMPLPANDVKGMYVGTYPTPRSFVIGVAVSF